MANFKFVKSATALVLGASVLTTAVIVPGANASAKTTYKVTKKGTLVNAKTNKTVKGYVTYKGKLYKNGKKLTGLYNKKYYYKNGVKATGTYQGAYYVKGAKKVTTGTYNGAYYVKGVKKVTTGTYNKAYYVAGKKVVSTGTYNKAYYVDGKKVVDTGLYQGKYYKDGVLNVGFALFNNELYKDADKNVGLAIDPLKDGKAYYDALLANGTYTDNGVEKAFENGVEVGAKVKSVEAINAKTVVITFNKAVDASTVITSGKLATNLSIESVTNANTAASLSEDGRTLTVKLNTALAAGDYSFNAASVKTKGNDDVAKAAKVFTVADKTAPTVVSATSNTNADKTNSVTVKFSEPVELGSVKVDGKFVTATPVDSNYKDTYTLTTAVDALEAGKTYDVEINNLKDAAGNAADAIVKTSVTVVKDTVKPVASLSSATGETSFDVKFDKEMSSTVSATNVKVYKTNTDGTQTQVLLSAVPSLNSDKKSYSVSLNGTGLFASTETSKTLTVKVTGLKDSLGNTMADYEGTVTITKDAVAPELVSVKQKNNSYNTLYATFSENVKNLAAGDFNVVDANGNVVTGAISSVDSTSTDKVAAITLDTTKITKTGTYKLVAIQGSFNDTSIGANANAAKVVSFDYKAADNAISPVTASFAATALDGTTATSTTSKKLLVKFNQADVVNGVDNTTGAYKDGAAEKLTNYTVDGSALPEGTVATFVDGGVGNDAVELDFTNVDSKKLPAAFVNGGDLAVSATGVKTVSGATLAYTTDKVSVKDLVAPTVTSAYLTKTSTSYALTVEFSEKVTAATVTDASLVLNDDATAVTLAGTTNVKVADDGKSAVFTYADGDAAAIAAAVTADKLKLGVTTTLTDAAATPNAATAATVTVVNYAK